MLNEKALGKAALSIAADTPLGQMHRSSEIAEKAIAAYLSVLLPEDAAGLVERLRADDLIYHRGPDYEPARIPPSDLRFEAASLIQSQAAESAADKARIAGLTDMLSALTDALEEAREDIEHWAGYAGDYFREKHDLDGNLDRISNQVADTRSLLNGERKG